MKISFVVLHYMAFEMTKKSVDMILDNFSSFQIQVVIVDNASSNNSGKKLKNLYRDIDSVKVIINEENLGFARGNNIGYDFAKASFSPDFIIVMNNDVLIRDKDFLLKVSNIYELQGFSVLGPDIYNPIEDIHQSPNFLEPIVFDKVLSKHEELVNRAKNFKKYYDERYKANILKRSKLLKKVYRFIKYKVFKVQKEKIDYRQEYLNPCLHGACYIFSKSFIEKREYALNPETFLYYEEDILFYECLKANLKMLYSPKIQVEHLEDVSTNMVYKSNYKKEEFKLNEQIKSSIVFLNILKKDL